MKELLLYMAKNLVDDPDSVTVTELEATGSNIVLGETEAIRSLDVHIEGVAADNTAPITVTLTEIAPVGLNMGNYKLYHVENGATNEMTLVASADAFTAHNQFKYDPATGDVRRYINIQNASVDVEGDLYLLITDYENTVIPDCAILTMDIELENLRMKSAHVKLDLDISIEDKNIGISDIPDMFSGEGTVVDLYNPILRFKLINGSPFNMYMNANITSYGKNHQTDIHIGDCTPYYDGEEHKEHSTDPVVIYAEDEVEYYFSRRGQHDGSSGTDIMLDKIGDIIKEMPESITIHDILVETDDNFVNIEANKECNIEMEYEFISPLAFGKDLRF